MRTSLLFVGILLLTPSVALAADKNPRVVEVIDVRCMQTAIEMRENTLLLAMSGYQTRVARLLKEREEDLLQAWSQAKTDDRESMGKAAFKAFKKGVASARQTFESDKRKSWKQYDKDRRQCGLAGTDPFGGALQNDLAW